MVVILKDPKGKLIRKNWPQISWISVSKHSIAGARSDIKKYYEQKLNLNNLDFTKIKEPKLGWTKRWKPKIVNW